MKIIAFNRLAGTPVESFGGIDIIPDSAMILPGKPLFVPDFGADRWIGKISLAFRINRLGKNISEKFAPRYYDSVSAALRFFPEGSENDMTRRGLLSGCDGTFVHGEWVPLPPAGMPVTISGPVPEATLSAADISIDSVIAAASRYMTLKTGDIILAAVLPGNIPAIQDTAVTINIDGSPNLNLRIK